MRFSEHNSRIDRFSSRPDDTFRQSCLRNHELHAPLERKRILVVEDDPHVAFGLQKRLSASGFDVVTTCSGHTAVQIARTERPEAITLDVQLPDLDGRQVAAILHNDEHTSRIPIVFVTSRARGRFKRECTDVGGRYFIRKPYDPDLLIQLLRSVLAVDELEEMRRISQAKRRQPRQ